MKRTSLSSLDKLAKQIDAELAEKEKVREQVLTISRSMIRTCAEAIKLMREGKRYDKQLGEARQMASKLKSVSGSQPDIYHSGAVENALQELAEAHILSAVMAGKEIPAPDKFDCTPSAFLLGLGDAIGEVRRVAQDALRTGDFKEAEESLAVMEEMYSALNLFDYPDAIVPVKHKQDVARGLIEKTRGEVAVSVRGRNLEEKIAALEKALSGKKRSALTAYLKKL
jgi:translin